ncbi:MAG: ribulose-phosphate 3-epimerase [Clostridia bacterium]|nr:ribulose-phosphate 3-epimerase [Clostridia bacterium]
MVKIAPSILDVNMDDLENEIKDVVVAGADYIHIDVMDGKFVPNETQGLKMLKVAKKATDITLDVHFMVENPKEYMQEFIENSDIITFHVEAADENTREEIIQLLRSKGKKIGMSIKPNTSIEVLIPYLNKIDMVLVMTVEPGFGLQKLIPETIEKIKELRKLKPELDIEVDGGINIETAKLVKEAGANILVAGTAVFKSENRKQAIEELRK